MDTTLEWTPLEEWTRIETIDAHTGGEPLRIVVDGLPPLEGETVLEKRRYMQRELDGFRRALMYEPRGHADMYGAVLTEPAADEADLGVIFTHNEGYSTMCGHGVIALATVLVEAGDHDGGPIRMETPAGPVTAHPTVADGRVENVAFENVPSFVVARDRRVEVPGVGTVAYDLAFGGAFYAYCRAVDAGVGLAPGDAAELVDVGRRLKAAVAADADVDIEHPHEAELSFLYGVVFTGEPENEADSRNVCVFADGEIDRCPTGTGVSGRLALRADDGRLDPGERFSVESIVGSTFTGWYGETTGVGGHEAVVPTVRGSAHLTGRHTFAVDPTDPLGEGFLLR